MQQLIRVYREDYTRDSVKEFNQYLQNGWKVLFITPIIDDKGSVVFTDYIIQKH